MQPSLELQPNQTIVFIGDSITDAGTNSPAYKPFGFGYVHFVANLLLAKYPHLNLRIVNSGVSGNTVRDLQSRWHTDCIELRPDILSTLVGINDVWGRHVEPDMLPTAADAHDYKLTYKRLLLQATEQCNRRLVLMK
jgi:lysophospholipase L1-like esterase